MSVLNAENPAQLAYREPARILALLQAEWQRIPHPVALAEVQRALNALTYAWLNDDGALGPIAAQLADILYACELEPVGATTLGDGLSRVARLGIEDDVAQLIAAGWEWWEARLEEHGAAITTDTTTVQAASAWEEARYASDDLAPIRRLATLAGALGEHCVDLVIHGSLSDLERTAYSDVDAWMVIRRETQRDAERLRDLKGALAGLLSEQRAFDPLQHHGIFVSSEADLRAYRQARMPLILLDHGTSLLGQPSYEVRCADDGLERAHALFRMASRVHGAGQAPATAHELKLWTSWLTLMVTLHHQQRRGYAYKPDALAASQGDFSPEAWRAIEQATALRAAWGDGDPLEVAARVAPDLVDNGRALAAEVLAALDSSEVRDAAWDEIDASGEATSDRLSVTDHPAFFSQEEHAAFKTREVARVAALPGVHSVWALGTHDTPTPGISDLDLYVIVEPGAPPLAPPPDEPVGRYIKWHDDVIRTQEEAEALRGYWSPAPAWQAGTPPATPEREPDPARARDARTLLLFKEGTFQLLKLLELLREPRFPLRTALLRAYTVTHDIRLAREDHDVSTETLEDFVDVITELRERWFDVVEPSRTFALFQNSQVALQVLHAILATVALKLEDQGRVDLAPLGGLREVVQHVGPHRLVYRRGDLTDAALALVEGRTRDILLPLAMLPIVYHVRPRARLEPALEPERLARTLDVRLRAPALAVRAAVEREVASGGGTGTA